MIVGNLDYKTITVTTADGEVVAVITDKEIVEMEGYKVIAE